MKDNKKEKITTSGSYRGHMIHATTYGRYIVVVYDVSYIVGTLPEAKQKIDDLIKARRN